MEEVQGSEVEIREMLAQMELGITSAGEAFISEAKAQTLAGLRAMRPKDPEAVLLAYRQVCDVLAQYDLQVKMVRRQDA